MRLASVEECRKIDELSTLEFGVPSEILMEAAGAVAAREILQAFFLETRRRSRVVIACGPGNNGADGLVVARHLHSAGVRDVVAIVLAPNEKTSELFGVQLARARAQGVVLIDGLSDLDAASREIERATLIVDALFGIGLRSDVEAPYRTLIERMNFSRAPIASLDTPSGLDANRGVALGIGVEADATFTFGMAKPGFFVSHGPKHVGRLHVLPIGFPKQLVRRLAVSRSAFTEAMAKRALPRRGSTSNKTHHGHAAIFAGQRGMWGAALLAATSAYRIGAGYVTLASNQDPSAALTGSPEILTGQASENEFWSQRKWQAAGIGPGLGVTDETEKLLERLLAENVSSVVVDADALTVIAKKRISRLPSTWILTPHAGELSRLIGRDAKAIEADRYSSAHEAAQKLGCLVLLKGFRTVLAHGGKVSVILSGNSALAKAGTGDVLTGFITGLLAQGVAPALAAASGAYVHGRLADEWVRSGREGRSLVASDLRDVVPDLLARFSATAGGFR